MAMLAGGEKNEKKKQQDTVVQPEQTTPGQTTGAQGTGATTATATQPGQNAQPSETVRESMGQTATPNTTTTTTTTTQNKRSATYENAMTTLKKAAGQTPQYSSPYDEEISSLYQQITNRAPFRYDYSTDPIYGQYREQYTQMGKQAMRDSMGQTAALTGGYGNSYGSAVGQQQYDAYLQRLNDVLPELYGQAYDIYNAEGDALRQQYALASDMRGTDYDRYRDALSDYRYDQSREEERARQLASDLGAYGDFSGYGELYGDDAAKRMQMTWAAANPLPAYMNGMITPEQYYEITGKYPYGYTPPGAGAAGSGGGGASGGWDPGNHNYTNRENYYRVTGHDPWGLFEK